MKTKTMIASFLLGIAVTVTVGFKSKTTDEKRGLGKVMAIEGKDVFINCEPIAPYETSFQFQTKAVSGFGCPSVTDIAKAVVKGANKNNLPYDAVIVGSAKYDLAIKYK